MFWNKPEQCSASEWLCDDANKNPIAVSPVAVSNVAAMMYRAIFSSGG
tara:strand:- start:1244 stop:1387 length:144 start_codon:yes stop_codon:yes gene_type:complete